MSSINLEPPTPEPTWSDKLEALGIEIKWNSVTRCWDFIGLTTEYDNDASLGYLMQDEEANQRVTGRDRETVLRLINEVIDPNYLELSESLTWDIFSYYSDGTNRGPSINIKLHDTYDFWRIVEKELDYEFPDEYEIDPHYNIWNDTIEWEWDWFIGTLIPEDYPHLDASQFMRLGRSGGHLVYDIYNRHLTVPEAWEFQQLEEAAPELVRGACAEIVHNMAAYALVDRWDAVHTEWLEGEEEAVADAVRAKDFEKAAWHQANRDAATSKEFFDMEDAREIVWPAIEKHLKDE